MTYIPDAYDQWRSYEARLQQELERCPRCDLCDEYIQDETLYVIHDTVVCEGCLTREFKRSADDYRD